jgi:hypothetical protein
MPDEAPDVDRGRLVAAAESQALFREVNERIKSLDETVGRNREGNGWVCECVNERCFERIKMSLVEYDGVRSDGNFFLVKPGHEVPDIEDVIDRHEEYVVVAKRGAGGVYAAKNNPRSENGTLSSPLAP